MFQIQQENEEKPIHTGDGSDSGASDDLQPPKTMGVINQSASATLTSKWAIGISLLSVFFTACVVWLGWVDIIGQRLSDDEIRISVVRELEDYAMFINGFYGIVDDSMQVAKSSFSYRGTFESTNTIDAFDELELWAYNAIDAAQRNTYRGLQDVLRLARVPDTMISTLPFLKHETKRWDSLCAESGRLKTHIRLRSGQHIRRLRTLFNRPRKESD